MTSVRLLLALVALAGCASSAADNGSCPEAGARATFYEDADGDGRGVAASTVRGCRPPDGYASDAGDCDDDDPAVYDGAPEVCNGADDDCDGLVDEGLAVHAIYPDNDAPSSEPSSRTTATVASETAPRTT